jgi:elongation factor Ts
MTEITAAMVKELRDATSAGMMDCKRALQETAGDFTAAVTLLREKGMASAAKRADRETTEGIVLTQVEGRAGAIAAVGCETEPVSKNEDFRAFADAVLSSVFEDTDPGDLEEQRVDLTARLGENIQIVGSRRFEAGDSEVFGVYVHPPANKVGVVVVGRGDEDVARQLAMHISFSKPAYTNRDEIPAQLVEAEREILVKLPEVESKPEDVREKIVDGMINKRFFAESVLNEQAWIHDSGLTVAKALAEAGFELVDYAWYSVG